MTARALQAGDRIWVGGGYADEVEWMAAARGDFGYPGTVVEFIPGQNQQRAAVIELDEELVLPDGAGEGHGRELRGKFLILELGHLGTDWATPRPRIHVELCEFPPEPKPWPARRKGTWVESHATYDYLDDEQR